MISDFVSVGDKLNLQKLKLRENEIDNNNIYISQLLDYVDEDKAKIAMPIEKGRIIPLIIGDRYILCFYTNKGLFQCNAVITNRYKNDNIYILEIQFLSELEKYQRRQFYRLECIIDITYRIITNNEIKLTNQLKENNFKDDIEKKVCIDTLEELKKVRYDGIITDLSGGGARFNSSYLHEHGDMIQMDFSIKSSAGIKACSLLVNIVASYRMVNRSGYYEHRVQFKDISKEDRETIIKFIFEEDRRYRRKEKELN